MNFRKYLILFFYIYSISNDAIAEPQTITLFCPPVGEVLATEQTGSWAKYKYKAYTLVNISELPNQLEMIGEGDTEKATIFQAATWTDRTFLCNYNSFSFDAIVIFETVLYQYVKNCYFHNTPHPSECNSNNPLSCPMTCELGKEED